VGLPRPDVDETGALHEVEFRTAQGTARIREVSYNADGYETVPVNLQRLKWNGTELELPEVTRCEFPDARKVELSLRLRVSAHARNVEGYVVFVAAHLRGRTAPEQLRVVVARSGATACGFDLELGTLEFQQDLLAVKVYTEECASSGDIIFRFELEARVSAHLLEALSVRGPFVDVNDRLLDDPKQGGFEEFLGLAISFRLHQLCFTRDQNERSQWGSTCIAGCDEDGSPLPPGAGVDVIWQSQLLEPDTEYAVRYRVRSYGSSQILREDEADDPPEKADFTEDSSSTPGSLFRTVRFRTEAAPSQEIKKYVGFTFPFERTGPLYPSRLIPVLSLKSRGLIRKIYEKHYGADVLRPKLVDFNGNAVEPVLTQPLEAGSTPFDEWLEQLAQECVPAARGFTYIQAEVWARNLVPAMDYSLQLEDSSQPDPRAAYSVSFRTSRYESFEEHVARAQDLFADATQVPVLHQATAAATLGSIIGGVAAGTRAGFDDAVEEVYRSLLGISNARLGPLFGAGEHGFAAGIVGREAGALRLWGMALELAEPLVGKEGVEVLNRKPGSEGLADRGIFLTLFNGQHRLLLRDRSGSRVLIFNAADAGTFTPIQTDTHVGLSFSQEPSVRVSVADYVSRTLIHKSPAEQAAEVTAIVNQLKGNAQTSALFEVVSRSLAIPMI
jgi:hypothetical protein